MKQRLLERSGMLRPVLSVAVGLILAAALMALSGYSPGEAFSALWTGATGLAAGPARGTHDLAFGSGHIALFQMAQSFSKMTPLLFCGLAVALGLRAGLFNIGAQGQMTFGALAAAAVGMRTGLPPLLHVPLTLAAGAIAGAAWGALPGLLKARRGVHEVISTIMLNFVALDIANYLVTHNMRDPNSQNPQTPEVAASAMLTPLIPHTALTIGLLLALLAALAVTLLIRYTALGYAIRAVGLGAEAARAAGIAVPRTLIVTMALSGALAGVAGAVEVMGVQHRYAQGIAASYGFDGIAVALLGGLGGIGVVLSALFFGGLASGSSYMESLTNVPAPISVIVQAVVIAFVGMRPRPRMTPAPAAPAPTTEPPTERKEANAAL
jgi:ABC-type uncharacterized transport system permease subunit